jgi:hypothetical protein
VGGSRDGFWRHRCFARFYLATKPSHVLVDVHGLAYSLHCPTVCDHQTRGQSFQSDVVLSHHVAVGDGAFPEGAKPLGLDI